MNIAGSLAATPVSNLDLGRYVAVAPTVSVADAVATMNEAGRSLACVVSEGSLVGVFTQRDFLMRVLGRSRIWDHPISDEMTRAIRTMTVNDSAADGLAIMNDWWIRSVPVLELDGTFAGSLSFYGLMCEIARLVVEHFGNRDSEMEDWHGLTLVDFTGINTSQPVTVMADDTVEIAAHHMKARGIGSVLVVDDHQHLIGMLTEFDLQTEIGCGLDDLTKARVADIMTPEPVAISARTSIAAAIQEMAERGFSHLPLLGESGRPVAVASFRDIAGYLESSFTAFG